MQINNGVWTSTKGQCDPHSLKQGAHEEFQGKRLAQEMICLTDFRAIYTRDVGVDIWGRGRLGRWGADVWAHGARTSRMRDVIPKPFVPKLQKVLLSHQMLMSFNPCGLQSYISTKFFYNFMPKSEGYTFTKTVYTNVLCSML